MRNKIRQIRLYSILILFGLASCETLRPPQSRPSSEKFERVNIGDNETLLKNIWGTPEQSDSEVYSASKLKVLTYMRKDGRPEAFFTLDPNSNKVVSKTLWVYPGSSYSNLKSLLDERFKGLKFQIYQPCKTRSDSDKIFVDESSGLYLATEKDSVILVSWSTPELTKNRVSLLFDSCPKLQTQQPQ